MKKLRLGEKAPDFRLAGVDGKNHTLKEFVNGHRAVVIIFTCNHCPESKAYEERLITLQNDYGPRGVQFVGINPNDASSYPEDCFERMKTHAQKRHFNFPYLRDELQIVARAYGAECTPEVYLLDRRLTLRYNGRVDDNWHDAAAVKSPDLRKALDELLAGKRVTKPVTPANGSSVKWKF